MGGATTSVGTAGESGGGSATVGAPAAGKKKLTYKEQRELAEIEPEIHRTEELAKQFEAQMNDPGVIGDYKKFEEVSRAFAAAQAKVATLFERWAELDARQ